MIKKAITIRLIVRNNDPVQLERLDSQECVSFLNDIKARIKNKEKVRSMLSSLNKNYSRKNDAERILLHYHDKEEADLYQCDFWKSNHVELYKEMLPAFVQNFYPYFKELSRGV